MREAMTLGELMRQVLRMQAQARELGEALAAYDGWQDIPGDNADYCARVADSIGWSLRRIRDSLREELKAAESQGERQKKSEG